MNKRPRIKVIVKLKNFIKEHPTIKKARDVLIYASNVLSFAIIVL